MPLPQLSHDEIRRKLHEKREIGSSPAIPSETCDFLSLGNRYVGSRATVSRKPLFSAWFLCQLRGSGGRKYVGEP